MKRIVCILFVLAIFINLTGCGKADLQTYREASKKTSEIKSGKMSYDIRVENEFNTAGLSQDVVKQLNYFRIIESKADITFSEAEGKNKIISRNYFNFGGMGFDSVFYDNKGVSFIKMPIVGKYMILEEMFKESQTNNDKENLSLDGTMKKIEEIWLSMLAEKDVVSGQNTILTTEDGEVKTTSFTIAPTEDQIRTFLKEVLDIIAEDKALENLILSNEVMGNGQKLSNGELAKNLENIINQIDIKDFSYTGYIDIDGYIIQEDIEVNMKMKDEKIGSVQSQKFTLQIKNWSIDKPQEFDFPELTEENTLDMSDMNQGVPIIFEDILGSEKKGDN